jgi:hypothetical protein
MLLPTVVASSVRASARSCRCSSTPCNRNPTPPLPWTGPYSCCERFTADFCVTRVYVRCRCAHSVFAAAFRSLFGSVDLGAPSRAKPPPVPSESDLCLATTRALFEDLQQHESWRPLLSSLRDFVRVRLGGVVAAPVQLSPNFEYILCFTLTCLLNVVALVVCSLLLWLGSSLVHGAECRSHPCHGYHTERWCHPVRPGRAVRGQSVLVSAHSFSVCVWGGGAVTCLACSNRPPLFGTHPFETETCHVNDAPFPFLSLSCIRAHILLKDRGTDEGLYDPNHRLVVQAPCGASPVRRGGSHRTSIC